MLALVWLHQIKVTRSGYIALSFVSVELDTRCRVDCAIFCQDLEAIPHRFEFEIPLVFGEDKLFAADEVPSDCYTNMIAVCAVSQALDLHILRINEPMMVEFDRRPVLVYDISRPTVKGNDMWITIDGTNLRAPTAAL
jgi:hypothetical protein